MGPFKEVYSNFSKYFKAIIFQTVNNPSLLPSTISRTFTFTSIMKNGEKRRVHNEKKLKLSIPSVCVFSVTWRCNLDCKGCYAKNYSVKKDLSPDTILKTIEECNDLGTFVFVIAGGEPLLVKGLIDRVASVKNGFFIFYTNGTVVKEKHIQSFKKAKNILPVISIEGEEDHTDLRRGNGVGQKVIDVMSWLRKEHIPFGFSTMVTHQNLKLVTSRKWIDTLWKAGARFGFLVDYIPVEKNLNKSFVLTKEDREFKEKTLTLRNNEAKPLLFNLPPDEYVNNQCESAGKGMMHINADGYVEPCPFCHFATDNIKEKSMQEILRSEFFSDLRELTKRLDNPNKECMLFSNIKEVKKIAKKRGAAWTEV